MIAPRDRGRKVAKMPAVAAKVQRRIRAPRFKVPNNELVIISVGNERMATALDCLSLTGGRIRSSKRFARGTFADLEARTVSGNFTAAIELLGEAAGNTQAFRFVQMAANDRNRLQNALNKMRAHGFGEKQPGAWENLLNLGRGLWTSVVKR